MGGQLMHSPLLRHVTAALGCLFAQSLFSALITLHFNQHTKTLTDAHVFGLDSGGYLLLELGRIEGKMLGHAGLESLLLIGAALPLLVLAHLHLLSDCARNSCPSGSLLARPTLDVFGSALLIRGARAVASFLCTWLAMRAGWTLLSDLNAGFRLHVLALLGLCIVILVFAWVLLSVMSDHMQLSGLLVDGERPRLRRRLWAALLDSITTPRLLGLRLARLVSSGALAALSVLVYRGLGSSLLSSALVQGLILLSILTEALWYRALTQQLLSARRLLFRPAER